MGLFGQISANFVIFFWQVIINYYKFSKIQKVMLGKIINKRNQSQASQITYIIFIRRRLEPEPAQASQTRTFFFGQLGITGTALAKSTPIPAHLLRRRQRRQNRNPTFAIATIGFGAFICYMAVTNPSLAVTIGLIVITFVVFLTCAHLGALPR